MVWKLTKYASFLDILIIISQEIDKKGEKALRTVLKNTDEENKAKAAMLNSRRRTGTGTFETLVNGIVSIGKNKQVSVGSDSGCVYFLFCIT